MGEEAPARDGRGHVLGFASSRICNDRGEFVEGGSDPERGGGAPARKIKSINEERRSEILVTSAWASSAGKLVGPRTCPGPEDNTGKRRPTRASGSRGHQKQLVRWL